MAKSVVLVPVKDLAELAKVSAHIERALKMVTMCAASLTPSARSDDPELHGAVADLLADDLYNDLDAARETLAVFRKLVGDCVDEVAHG